MRTDSRPNRTPTAPIIPHFKLLQGDTGSCGDSTDDERCGGVGGVALVGVGFDDDAAIYEGAVSFLVGGVVVRVELSQSRPSGIDPSRSSRDALDLPHDPYHC